MRDKAIERGIYINQTKRGTIYRVIVKCVYIGTFDDYNKAVEARDKALKEL